MARFRSCSRSVAGDCSERPSRRGTATWAPAGPRTGARGVMDGLHMVTDDHSGYRLSPPGPDLVASPPTFQFPYVPYELVFVW